VNSQPPIEPRARRILQSGTLYSALPADLTGERAARGPQLADQHHRRFVFGDDPERPTASLDGGPQQPVDADLLRRAWLRTYDGTNNQDPPTAAEFAEAADVVRARAVAAARRSRELAAVAADAQARAERVDAAAHRAATDARRGALERELRALDQEIPVDPHPRP